MKAIRVSTFGGPEVLIPSDVPDPTPGPGEVVVKVDAAGVNPVDTYIRAGTYARKPELPYTPGADGAGTVEDVGTGVQNVRKGDRVYVAGSLSGTYAERALCSASQVHPLPNNVSFSEGAAVGIPYATAHFALFHRARAQRGETVLVHGATGGVGLAAVQLARRAGMTVIGTGGSEAGRAMVALQGADLVLDHADLTYTDAVREFTKGRGVDVVLEMLANVNLGKDLTLLAAGGRVAVIGSRGTVEINPRDAMSRNADVLGVMLTGAAPELIDAIHRDLAGMLERGEIKPIVGREFALADAAEAHRAVMEPGASGKIVLRP
jgi:NADPH:quinone reductase